MCQDYFQSLHMDVDFFYIEIVVIKYIILRMVLSEDKCRVLTQFKEEFKKITLFQSLHMDAAFYFNFFSSSI